MSYKFSYEIYHIYPVKRCLPKSHRKSTIFILVKIVLQIPNNKTTIFIMVKMPYNSHRISTILILLKDVLQNPIGHLANSHWKSTIFILLKCLTNSHRKSTIFMLFKLPYKFPWDILQIPIGNLPYLCC